METKTFIIVRLQVDGIHNFPAAKELFPAVGFLANEHRHVFRIECKREVFHDDRDVEFILFKGQILDYLSLTFRETISPGTSCNFGSMSCEMIARELLERFDLQSCSVFEDGENGAIIEKV